MKLRMMLSALLLASGLGFVVGCGETSSSKSHADDSADRSQMLDDYADRTKVKTAVTQIKIFEDALEQFRGDMGEYPKSLRELVEKPNDSANREKWMGPYLKPAAIPKDPWGQDYVYRNLQNLGGGDDEREFEIICYGADGQPGGKGCDADITNFESY